MTDRKRVQAPPLAPDLGAKIIWTAAAIGGRIGCSSDFVRNTLAEMPGTPIKRISTRLYVFEDELIAWLRDPSPK